MDTKKIIEGSILYADENCEIFSPMSEDFDFIISEESQCGCREGCQSCQGCESCQSCDLSYCLAWN